MVYCLFSCFFKQPYAVVGYGNKNYPGYHKMTQAEFLNRAIRQRLFELHVQRAGFPLAEPILVIKDRLCVAEGKMMIDGSQIHVVGKVAGLDLAIHDVFAAMNWDTKVAWTRTPPRLDGVCSVKAKDNIGDKPCVFIRSVRRRFHSPPPFPNCGRL